MSNNSQPPTTAALLASNSAPRFISTQKVTTAIGKTEDHGAAVALQTDGKIVVAGYSNQADFFSTQYDFAVVRYNANGSLDSSFSGDGKVTTDSGFLGDDSATEVVIQSDGKILVVGTGNPSASYSKDIFLVRYNSNGSLDTSFSGDGKVTTDLGSVFDYGGAIHLQTDGKILVAGQDSANDFALLRYNSDGSLDTRFSGDGKTTTDIFFSDNAASVTVQNDGKILVAGSSSVWYFSLIRYNADGTLDTSFSEDGIVTTRLSNSYSSGNSVALQADGKILMAGSTTDEVTGNSRFGIVRYNPNGTLDTSFSDDGMVTTAFGAALNSIGNSIAIQADGKILVGGFIYRANSNFGFTEYADFALARYNSDGSLDTSFGGDGKITTSISLDFDYGYSLAVQADGKIILAGTTVSNLNSDDTDFAVIRYNTDGSLDNSFGTAVNNLNSTARYYEGGEAVVLSDAVQIIDAELAAQGNYKGASLTLSREGGANADDLFSATGKLSFVDNKALLDGVSLGSVSNSNGMLKITFNANATQAKINQLLSSLAYASSASNLLESIKINWIFNDGNTGAQGSGGDLSAIGTTTVSITNVNQAPTLPAPASINYLDTAFDDSFGIVSGFLNTTDADGDTLTYAVLGGKNEAGGLMTQTTTDGTLTLNTSTGEYSFAPIDTQLEQLTSNKSLSFDLNVSDGSLMATQTLIININQSGITESNGNDTLTGSDRDDVMRSLRGDDNLSGLKGNDQLRGGQGNDYLLGGQGDDNLHGENGNDVLLGGLGDDRLNGNAGLNTLTGGAGKDAFIFDSALGSAMQTITDFSVTDDTIRIHQSVFSQITGIGILDQHFFTIGSSAKDGNDYLFYDRQLGALFYDADGNGDGGSIQIALLATRPDLSNAHFWVI
ncbi:hypothetical protein JCM14076_03250 [Methylosoma difficile]